MANAILHTTTYINPAGTRFRLRKVEGYGWELHQPRRFLWRFRQDG